MTWVTLVLVVVVVGGGYLAWVWGPLYFERYMVKQVVREYLNQAVKNPADDRLRSNMVAKLRTISTVPGVDRYGQPVKLPAVDVDESAVLWDRQRDATPPILRVAFEYERLVVYPLLERTETKVFEIDMTGDLSPPDWGPAR